MAALGRILQIVGWLWLIVGFFGPMFGFLSLNLLPGIILVFVARVIRKQAERREMPELGEQAPSEEQEQPDTRTAETSRQRRASSSPEPYVLGNPSRSEPAPEQKSDQRPAPRRRDLLEEVVGLDRDDGAREESSMSSDQTDQTTDTERRRKMSSAEMIARAHERWDSKRS